MTTTIIVAIVAVVVALLIAVPVTCKVAVNNKIQKDAEIVGTAEDKARSIIPAYNPDPRSVITASGAPKTENPQIIFNR